MKKAIKAVIALILITVTVISTSSCSLLAPIILGESSNDDSELTAEEELYELVNSHTELLDSLSADIITNWNGYIYNKKYNSIQAAFNAAIEENEETVNNIYDNDEKIVLLYQGIRDDYSDMSYSAQELVTAYNAYYTAVLDAQGRSYEFYTATIQQTRYSLAFALKNYYTEM